MNWDDFSHVFYFQMDMFSDTFNVDAWVDFPLRSSWVNTTSKHKLTTRTWILKLTIAKSKIFMFDCLPTTTLQNISTTTTDKRNMVYSTQCILDVIANHKHIPKCWPWTSSYRKWICDFSFPRIYVELIFVPWNSPQHVLSDGDRAYLVVLLLI